VKPRGRLFRQYVIVLAALVSGPLLASGAISVYLSYQQNKTALVSLQREKAGAAAAKIDGFIKEIERQIGWTTQPQLGPAAAQLDQRRVEYLRLQTQAGSSSASPASPWTSSAAGSISHASRSSSRRGAGASITGPCTSGKSPSRT
jgi:hypothetical protein